MNNLCADIGYKSINHEGEQLCGDHVDIVEQNENSTVIVLADGLGSGVKASILSTLTSKIISTMMASGLKLEDCVSTIAATLPICSQRGVAYSTFTIIHIKDNEYAEVIQYDNPNVIFIRDGEVSDYPKSEAYIGNKKILKSTIKLQEEDIFVDEEVVEAEVVDEDDLDAADMDAGSTEEESAEAVVEEEAEATANETDLDALDGTVIKEVDDSEAVKPAIEEAIEQEIMSKESLSE